MIRLSEELIKRETLDGVQIRRIVAGLPLDDDGSESNINEGGTPQKSSEEGSLNPFKKPILPPITGNNPATA